VNRAPDSLEEARLTLIRTGCGQTVQKWGSEKTGNVHDWIADLSRKYYFSTQKGATFRKGTQNGNLECAETTEQALCISNKPRN